VIDQNPSGYGEWSSSLVNLVGRANPGDAITVQWSELFNISDGEMRVTVGFFNAGDVRVAETHFVARGQSGGAGFPRGVEFHSANGGPGRTGGHRQTWDRARVGGSEATMGEMVVDDLSVLPRRWHVCFPGIFGPIPRLRLANPWM